MTSARGCMKMGAVYQAQMHTPTQIRFMTSYVDFLALDYPFGLRLPIFQALDL
jgi:hypothetical protein